MSQVAQPLIQPPVKVSKWQQFISLGWYNRILDFFFHFTAISSEILLAVGVILATVNHFQHGALFATALVQHGKTLLVDTPIFGAWTWTQAVGFEASAGVVLLMALTANRDNDKIKRNILLTLMTGLALVGTTMLVMSYVEASTGIQESSLPEWYGIIMAIFRGVVSVAYVTIGRVKSMRFSGNPVMQPTEIPDVMGRLNQLEEILQGVGQRAETRIQQLEVNTESRVKQIEAVTKQQNQQVVDALQQGKFFQIEGMSQMVDRVQTIDTNLQLLMTERLQLLEIEFKNTLSEWLQGELQSTLATQLSPIIEVLGDLEDIGELAPQLSTVTKEFQQVRITVEQQVQLLPQRLERLVERRVVASIPAPATKAMNGSKQLLSLPAHKAEQSSSGRFNKTQFVLDCLKEDPEMPSIEMKKRASDLQQDISDPIISMARSEFKKQQLLKSVEGEIEAAVVNE